MATPAPPQPWWDTDYVQITSHAVKVDLLAPMLRDYVMTLGRVHMVLFGKALEITSGNDGKHVAGSAHYINKAVDLRSIDFLDEERAIFALVLGYFSRLYKVAVFDERFTASPHWHIQTADSVGG